MLDNQSDRRLIRAPVAAEFHTLIVCLKQARNAVHGIFATNHSTSKRPAFGGYGLFAGKLNMKLNILMLAATCVVRPAAMKSGRMARCLSMVASYTSYVVVVSECWRRVW